MARFGRPPKFETAEEMQEKILEYFDEGCRSEVITIKKGVETKALVRIPTITGLCNFLGFADRCSFYRYGEKPEFSYTIKRARQMIEQVYEEQLHANANAGAIFALKNFGWTDKQTLEHSGPGGKPIEVSDLERAKRITHILDNAMKRKQAEENNE